MKSKTTIILLAVTALLFGYLYFIDKKSVGTQEASRQSQNVVNVQADQVDGIDIQNGDVKIELRKKDKKWRLESPIKDQADSTAIDTLLSDIESWPKTTTISAKEIEADKNSLSEYGLTKPKLRLKLIGKDTPPEILIGKDAALEGKMYARFDNSKDTFVVSQAVRKAIDKKPDDFRDRKLTELNTTQVTRFSIKSKAGELEAEKKNEHWDLVRPIRARGDDQKIGDLIAQITTAQIQQFVADDRGDLNAYGLTDPRGSVTIFGDNDKTGQTLQIGADLPDKSKDLVYARFTPRGFVYALPNKLLNILENKPNDLRDRHLARVDRNNLDRLSIQPAGKPAIVLARKDEAWTIASQNNAAANSEAVTHLIDAVADEQVTKFVEDVASNLGKYGLESPSLQLVFSSFASENTAETKAGDHPFLTIAFGKTEGDIVYARIGDEPFVLAVRRSLLDKILVDPLQWQSLVIYNFKPDQVHRVTVKSEKEQTVVREANKAWKFAQGTTAVDQVNLQSLLNALTSLRALRWVGATKPEHGFNKPSLVVAFTTSADDKASQKLTVGAPPGDGTWFARVDGRDGTFLISAADFNALKLSLAQVPVPTPAPAGSAAPTASVAAPAVFPAPGAPTSASPSPKP